MVSQSTCAAARGQEAYMGYMDRDWRLCKPQSLDARSDGTMDEAVDLAYMEPLGEARYCYSPRTPSVSGLPLVCSNCGVSFFSLQIPDDQVDCYCSGECKWSVIMYREMDLRLYAMRRPARRHQQPQHATPLGSTCSSSSFYGETDDDDDDESLASFSFSDDSTASSK